MRSALGKKIQTFYFYAIIFRIVHSLIQPFGETLTDKIQFGSQLKMFSLLMFEKSVTCVSVKNKLCHISECL